MKLYEKPIIDITKLSNKDAVAVSGGGLTKSFTKMSEGDSGNKINIDSGSQLN